MQQPQKNCSSREMRGISSSLNSSQIPPPLHHQIQNPQIQLQHQNQTSHFDQASHDDFFDQMLSTLPPSSSWSDLSSSNPKSPFLSLLSQSTKLRDLSDENLHLHYDETSTLAARLRHQQLTGSPISGGDIASQLLLSRASGSGVARSPCSTGDTGLLRLPLSLGSAESSDSVS